jgi:sugar/nucleoside kinase (ribokinase family)
MGPVDYLVIGHVAKDITPTGHALGGTATYSAVTAQRLGLHAAIVTAADPECAAEVQAALPGIRIYNKPSPQTTTFENTYGDLGRTQYLRAHAESLGLADVPAEWRDARIVHLGPIARECEADLVGAFPNSLVALTPQGWLRQWDESGEVSPRPWPEALEVLKQTGVIIFSPEDVGHDWELIYAYTRATQLAVLTLERHGALVFAAGLGRWIAPRTASVVDPTGAGDVFTAAFLTIYSESNDSVAAAHFANVAASFSIENGGVGAIPTREKVKKWVDTHRPFRA